MAYVLARIGGRMGREHDRNRARTVVRFRERQIRECATVRQLRWGGAEGKFYRETIASPRSQRAFNFGARPQRLLLASTGTKDPRASDILYINGLAAPNTVNTMPEGTLKAFAEHGEVGAPMPPDGGDSDAVLAQFGKAGIDIDALAARLREEGAASFVKSWHDRVEKRCAREGFVNILVIDVGGTHVKILATGQDTSRRCPSGSHLTAKAMVTRVKRLAGKWKYDAVSIGYPGPVLRNRPVAEPHNLGRGWVGFDFEAAFRRPVQVVNDAAMQALGSYKGGKMLFLGLGTGLGSTLVVDKIVEPLELGHLPYKKGTFEDYVGLRALERVGTKRWRKNVEDVVERLIAALEPDDVVLGGGNVKWLEELPPGCRAGDNANAFLGGFQLWKHARKPRAAKAGHRRAR